VDDDVRRAERLEGTVERRSVGDVGLDQDETLPLLDVVAAAGGEVVDDDDLVVSRCEPVRQMGADEAGSARYQHFQPCHLPSVV